MKIGAALIAPSGDQVSFICDVALLAFGERQGDHTLWQIASLDGKTCEQVGVVSLLEVWGSLSHMIAQTQDAPDELRAEAQRAFETCQRVAGGDVHVRTRTGS